MKHIFIWTFFISFLNLDTLSMHLIPAELVGQITQEIHSATTIISSVQKSEYDIRGFFSDSFNNRRLLPSSFNAHSGPVCRSLYWKGWFHHATSNPENITTGFEASGRLGFPDNEISVPWTRYLIHDPTKLYSTFSSASMNTDIPIVDSNSKRQGCVAYYYPSFEQHHLCFFGKNKGILPNIPGMVTALTMYPNTERVVYLTDHYYETLLKRVYGVASQRMRIVGMNDKGEISTQVSATTPDYFKKVVPFKTENVFSHFALSKDGSLWETSRGDKYTMHYQKQVVRDRFGQEKVYQNIATTEDLLLATLDFEGNVFIGNPLFKLLMRLTTIPNAKNVIRFSHTKGKAHTKEHQIHIVYEKPSFFSNSYPITTISYDYDALYTHYMIKMIQQKNHTA